MRVPFLALLSVFLFLSGCDGSSHRHGVSSGPYLNSFGLVDSYGYDSNLGNGSLHLDTYRDYGLFEVYWEVDSNVDYRITVSVNDAPHPVGAVRLSSEVCGPGRSCDWDGYHVCEYTPDFYMGCGIDLTEIDDNLRSIEHFFRRVPDTLYLNLEMCDLAGRSCVVDSLLVTAH